MFTPLTEPASRQRDINLLSGQTTSGGSVTLTEQSLFQEGFQFSFHTVNHLSHQRALFRRQCAKPLHQSGQLPLAPQKTHTNFVQAFLAVCCLNCLYSFQP